MVLTGKLEALLVRCLQARSVEEAEFVSEHKD